ncbi:MAG: hypothetical protein NW237_12350 [Cyanobacteriota bacterium]|nr:hypothetical protein [Cyanobacteriota bacterium]
MNIDRIDGPLTRLMQDPKLRLVQSDNSARLTINVDGPYLPLDKFRAALNYFSQILVDVDKETSENGSPTIEWAITDVRNGSLHLTVEANVLSEDIELKRPSDVISIFKKGIQSIQDQGIRPEGFSNKSIKAAKQFANILDPDNIAEIGFRSNGTEVKIQPQLFANATQIISNHYKYFGSVEGTLVSISVAKRRQFGIRVSSQNKIIKCFFQHDMQEEAKNYLEKRVYVYGLIRQLLHGDKVNVEVQEIKRLPDWSEAVSAEALLRMIRGES